METCFLTKYRKKLAEILTVLECDPYEPTHWHYFEKLKGPLKDRYSRRINSHHRVVYTVLPNTEGSKDKDGNPYQGIVRIYEAWGHKYKKPKR